MHVVSDDAAATSTAVRALPEREAAPPRIGTRSPPVAPIQRSHRHALQAVKRRGPVTQSRLGRRRGTLRTHSAVVDPRAGRGLSAGGIVPVPRSVLVAASSVDARHQCHRPTASDVHYSTH